MAIAFKAALGNAGNTTSGSGLSVTLTAGIAVGDLVVVRYAVDNVNASNPTFTNINDGVNTYTSIAFRNAGQASPATAVVGGIAACKATTAVSSGAILALNISAAVAAKAMYVESYTGAEVTLRSTAVTATATSTAASVVSGTVNAGDLVIGAVAVQSRGTPTYDADTLNGAWAGSNTKPSATTGSDASNVCINGQYKIPTAGGAQTYDNTVAATYWVGMIAVFQPSPTTPVSTSRATTWDTDASVVDTQATTWRVLRTVVDTQVTTWNTLKQVSAAVQERMLADTTPPSTGQGNYTIGVRFTVATAGQITHIRFFSPYGAEIKNVALWTAADGVQRGSAISAAGPVGWFETALSTPVTVAAGTQYIASYSTGASGSDHYPYDTIVPLTSQSPNLTNPESCYASAQDTVPNIFPGPVNYFVDVVYLAGGGGALSRTTTWNVLVDAALVSVMATRVTLWAVLVSVAPSSPVSLVATANPDGTVGLTWSVPASDGGAAITDYIIEYQPYVPITTDGQIGWFDAADESTMVYAVNPKLAQWKDKSPSGLHGNTDSNPAFQPVRVTNGVRFVQSPAPAYVNSSIPGNTKPLSCLAVINADSTGVFPQSYISGPSGNASGAFNIRIMNGGGIQTLSCSVTGISNSTSNVAFDRRQLVTYTYSASGVWVCRINGVPAGTGTNDITFNPTALTQLGCSNNYGGDCLKGDMHELIKYDRVLSDSEIVQVEWYLIDKWGIGLQLWLDASDASTFTYSSGSKVSQWRDKSLLASTVDQATVGQQPTRVTSPVPAVRFDGGDDTLVNTVTNLLPTNQGVTVLVVYKYTGGPSGWALVFSFGNQQWGPSAKNNSSQIGVFNGGIWRSSGIECPVVPFVQSYVGTPVAPVAGNVGLNNSASANIDSPPNPTNTGYMVSGNPVSMDVMEIRVYNFPMSDAIRQQAVAALMTKWGIT